MTAERMSNGDLTVVWTRGKGCLDLASVLGGDDSDRVGGDLAESCIEHRADLLIAKRLPSNFDLLNVAVPIDFEPQSVEKVVATVGGGPHSQFAAELAVRLAEGLDVPVEAVSAVDDEDDEEAATDQLQQLSELLGSIPTRVVVGGVEELPESLEEGTLVVLGAPGGSWISRSRTGPGARLRRSAQGGVVVVRASPDRVFRFMDEPVYVAPMRTADDTLRLHPQGTLAVAEEGRLIGLVRREGLKRAGSAQVASVMEDARSVRVDATLLNAWDLQPEFGPDPIPVTDHDEHLVGGLSLTRG